MKDTMKPKFSFLGLLNVISWAISIIFFFSALWWLFGGSSDSYSDENYAICLLFFLISNPKIWQLSINKIFR